MDSFQLSLIIIPPICGAIGYILKSFCNKYSEKNELKRKDNLRFIEFKLKNFYYPIYTNLLREDIIWKKFIRISNKKKLTYTNTILSKGSKFHNIFKNDPNEDNIILKSNNNLDDDNNIIFDSNNDNILLLDYKPNKDTKDIIDLIDTNDYENQKILIELDKEILNIHLNNQEIIKSHFISINPNDELKKVLIKYDEHITIYNILRKININIECAKDLKFPKNFDSEFPKELVDIIKNEYEILIKDHEDFYKLIV